MAYFILLPYTDWLHFAFRFFGSIYFQFVFSIWSLLKVCKLIYFFENSIEDNTFSLDHRVQRCNFTIKSVLIFRSWVKSSRVTLFRTMCMSLLWWYTCTGDVTIATYVTYSAFFNNLCFVDNYCFCWFDC